MRGLFKASLGALFLLSASVLAQAATCGGTTTSFTLTPTATATSCTGGTANLNNAQSLAAASAFATTLGYTGTLLELDYVASSGVGTELNLTGGDPVLNLAWSIVAPGYKNFIILLKAGSGDLAYALFGDLTASSGTYTIFSPDANPNNNDYQPALSHAYLYGYVDNDPGPPPVPLPGAVWLMITGAVGLLGACRWRKRTVAA